MQVTKHSFAVVFMSTAFVVIPMAAATSVPTTSPTSGGPTTFAPTRAPTTKPTFRTFTLIPRDSPTKQPTKIPTAVPTKKPVNATSTNPTTNTTAAPMRAPTKKPTQGPTKRPTNAPTNSRKKPSSKPTVTSSPSLSSSPSRSPSRSNSRSSSPSLSSAPSRSSSPTRRKPTKQPSKPPTNKPTQSPTLKPTSETSGRPTKNPNRLPTESPTLSPTLSPTIAPSLVPTASQSSGPTVSPTIYPSLVPTSTPSGVTPTMNPSFNTEIPTQKPAFVATNDPTFVDSDFPTQSPTIAPSFVDLPTQSPTIAPSFVDNGNLTQSPSLLPTITPTFIDNGIPTQSPSLIPTGTPSFVGNVPTQSFTEDPTMTPSFVSTITPSLVPTLGLTVYPSSLDTNNNSSSPTIIPSLVPTLSPSLLPTLIPSEISTQNETSKSNAPSPRGSIVSTLSPVGDLNTNRTNDDEEASPTESPSTSLSSSSPTTAPSDLSSAPIAEPSASNLSSSPSISSSSTSRPSYDTTFQPTLVPTRAPSIEPTIPKTLWPSVSNAPTPLYKPSSSPSRSAFPSVQPSHVPSFISTSETMISTPPSSLLFAPSSSPTPLNKLSSSPSRSSSPSFQPSPIGLRLPLSGSPSKRPITSDFLTTFPSPVSTVSSPPVEKLQLSDSPTPERVNPGPALSDDEVTSTLVCLPSKNDTSETLAFNDDSVPASTCIDDVDPYRTCIWRGTTSERCDRMVKNKPFVDIGETLVEGTIHVTLSQNPVATSCRNIIQMEKALLTFLADNLGSSETFEPACVYTVYSARDSQLSNGQPVESTALKYNLMFIQKHNPQRAIPANIFQSDGGRSLDECSTTDEVMCCSQYVINGNLGAYCNSLGCSVNKCGSGRRPRELGRKLQDRDNDRAALAIERRTWKSNPYDQFQGVSIEIEPPRHSNIRQPYFANPDLDEPTIGDKSIVNSCSFYGQLTGEIFNDVVRTYSEFKPEMSRSLLGVDDTLSVAVCSSNRFSIEILGTPSLTCDQFMNESCSENEDIVTEDSTPTKKSSMEVLPNPGGNPKRAEMPNDDGTEFSANKVHSNAVGTHEEEWLQQTVVLENSCDRVAPHSIFHLVFLLLSSAIIFQSLY